ncbi:undecaprenyldiphospho-muramoylpentapeptide beta-N-acetylglucosaminyltransferase [Desulfovibrio ferrophilus]|uniref:UDP-N-acetylglucosamine--N-acetylmuramyl-(pentapeptide) pyrophosphoryl-undecaprenol N-acetylglucosamine transferase n=1 Tax=Desulfovibrio ferrophilus TaxID=241368 RepID=A0A2Z6AZ58_9BACT|nr:undecaprenyldiphospho-muramoylpentapeptide beta-N-acetylglucosaminyltransferase [Desulfovibrio ferrophilus]BBD08544.1 UDP-N-acetylglucosamine--N-acetylmuramyl-(pentapeptide) pyrophosphoryl-undecaprenol N-acetylglucosamine transferase [Desulfovibrio ferrophilus]
MQRIVLTTGGTGGHIFPALAVAEEIKRRHPDCDVLFVGGKHGREREFAERAGLRFLGLPVRGVIGRGFRAVGAVFGLGLAVLRSWWLMLRFKPQVVLGFGGYAGFAPVLAACLRGVPCAVHEQNSYPGSTNRLLGKWVNRVFTSFPDAHGFFDAAKVEMMGNPVRTALVKQGAELAPQSAQGNCKRLLIVGGSQGAHAINKAVTGSLQSLRDKGFELWHQTGEQDLNEVRAAYAQIGWKDESARIDAFIDNMAEAYAWADAVLCRAGATTVAELTVVGKASVLIPFPQATHNHQLANAQYLERGGAAVILMQNLLDEIDLADSLYKIFEAPERLSQMCEAARSLGRPDAAKRLVDAIEEMAGN